MKRPERTTALGDEQTPGRFAVEPMHEIHPSQLGPQAAQRFDAADADAATAVHGHARRFVEHEDPAVLIEDVPL